MDQPTNSSAYHVAWHVDGDAVREDVTLRIANGRMVEIQSGCAGDAMDLGNVALIPGLVNAHTHLEFSLLREPIPTTGRFTDWIRAVVKYRREHPDDVPRAIRAGVAESIRSGTTLIGEIATSGWSENDYLTAGFSGTIFQELLGLGDERIATQQALARSIALKQQAVPRDLMPAAVHQLFEFGLSPHAPYSVHPELLRVSAHRARQHALPMAMHLAETESELELLATAAGEFRELLTEFGIWREGVFGGQRPLDVLKLLAKSPRVLVVHGNYLDDEELAFLAAHPHMTLVYCPRTHAAFGHRAHPWRRLLELGGSVAIGTDSRASNPDLSLFAELQFLAARSPDLSHLELLKLGSQAGRAALLGDVDSGRADYCLVEWDPRESPDPARNLFASRNRVVRTMIGGTWSTPPKQICDFVDRASNPDSAK